MEILLNYRRVDRDLYMGQLGKLIFYKQQGGHKLVNEKIKDLDGHRYKKLENPIRSET